MEEDVTRAVAKKNYPASPSLFVLYYTFSCCHLCYCDASSCFAFPSCLVPCRCYGNILANNVTAMHDCDAPKQWNHATQQTHYWYDVISDAARPEKDRDSLSGGCADTGHRPSSQHIIPAHTPSTYSQHILCAIPCLECRAEGVDLLTLQILLSTKLKTAKCATRELEHAARFERNRCSNKCLVNNWQADLGNHTISLSILYAQTAGVGFQNMENHRSSHHKEMQRTMNNKEVVGSAIR